MQVLDKLGFDSMVDGDFQRLMAAAAAQDKFQRGMHVDMDGAKKVLSGLSRRARHKTFLCIGKLRRKSYTLGS